ncbi:XdhC family protein [Parvularcula oceani]|uniref:XdhC family protein n=1 Tax=Parvularcula oceani TaxID=1247963 RepID=UPI0004E15137|nr:XdhC family protein [Parvularcula oceani]
MSLADAAPEDVLSFAIRSLAEGPCALGVVAETVGGGVRAPGALFAVRGDGAMAGYVSNGCVDADIAEQALGALAEEAPRRLRYGEGSPFTDVRLPCGGAVEVLIAPHPCREELEAALSALHSRSPVGLHFPPDGTVAHARAGAAENGFAAQLLPRLRLRVVGRGAEPVALMRVARAAGFALSCWSPDEDVLAEAGRLGAEERHALLTPQRLPEEADDPRTAVVLLFHDHDWEPPVLAQALAGRAFYIGALGSRRAQAARRQALEEMGVEEAMIGRLHGPIGLVPSLRDAPAVAVSILAEIIAAAR